MIGFRSTVRLILTTTLAMLGLYFPHPGWSGSIGIDLDVVPSATTTGVLSIQRVELNFDNGLPETTVAINGKLKARAAIRYVGNGALIGYWMVDGRPLQTINTSLTFGNSITLETTDLPPLPTLEPGDHEVTLRLSVPAVGFALPVIRYHVETAAAGAPLTLVQPADSAILTRPRRDGLLVSGNTVTGNTSSNTLMFSWRPPVIISGGLALRGARVSSYRLAILRADDPAHPLVTAQVNDPWYALPAALAVTLPAGQELVWVVEALNAKGAVLASSEQRRVSFRSPSSIELLSPAEGEAISESQSLSWRSTRNFDHYEVRAYLNSVAMLDYFTALARAGRSPTTGGTAVFTASTVASGIVMPQINPDVVEPGLVLYWVVIARDQRGTIQDISEVGSFHLSSDLASLNGQPRTLLMSGFEIAVDSYRIDTPPWVFSGSGSVRFVRDRAQHAIALNFTTLNVEPFREQTRQISGSGANQKTVISEILKGRVTEGRITQTFTTPPTLDMQGYDIALHALTLDAGVSGGAWADLTLTLDGYRNGAGVTPAALELPSVALEAGGDFFAEVGGLSATTLTTTTPTVAGLTLAGGTFIADFSVSRDFLGIDGLPVARDAGIFLMGGSAKLDAATLFPVTAPQQIQLAYDAIELKADGYDGTFTVTGSDDITPVVPADYRLHFTTGSLAIAHGALQAATLTLDGVTELPTSVRSVARSTSVINFKGLRPVNGTLLASAEVTDLEWGPVGGGSPFRLLNASGELRLPYGTAIDWQHAGLRVTRGTMDAPIRSQGEIGVTTPSAISQTVATSSTTAGAAKGNSTIFSNQNQLQGNVTASQISAALAGNQFDLHVRTGGVNGTLKWSANFDGKIGDFDASFNMASFTFVDNAVTDSRLDGELVVPAPANFKLGFSEATITGSGEIVGPKLVAPGEIALDYWRVKLVLPTAQSALIYNSDGPLQLALANTATISDVPLMLAAAKANVPLTQPLAVPPPAAANARVIMLPPVAPDTGVLVLSRSYLRFNGPQLQFLLDAKYGPMEFDPLELQSLEIRADGQIRSSRLRLLSSHFLQMNILADSAAALIFEPYSGGQPVPGAPLLSIKGNITFPRLGERYVTLAHTVSGARADNLTPNGGGYGNPDLLRFEAANLVYHNAYAEGKGQYKEFLGTTQIAAVKALYLNGLMMVGADDQGVYERIGLGIGVDPIRAASLYASGAISVGAKLGGGAINMATGGKSTAETEVANLLGSIAELATDKSDKFPEKLIKSLADVMVLVKRIHRDNGGSADDPVGTSLAVANIALDTSATFLSDTDRSEKRIALAILNSLDLALAQVERIKTNGQPLPQDARNTLAITRFVTKATRATVDDGQLSRAEWIELTSQLLAVAAGFSSDQGYQLTIQILTGVVDAARISDHFDDMAALRIAINTLKVVQQSGIVNAPEARDAMVLSQAALVSVMRTNDFPNVDRAIAVTTDVLESATGTQVQFGGGTAAEDIKHHLKMAQRTLQLVGQISGGIDYTAGAQMVQTTLHEVSVPSDQPYDQTDALVSVWAAIDQRPVTDSINALRALKSCTGNAACQQEEEAQEDPEDDPQSWAGTTSVAAEVEKAVQAQNYSNFMRALKRLYLIYDVGTFGLETQDTEDFETAFSTAAGRRVETKARTLQGEILGRRENAATLVEFWQLHDQYEEIESLIGHFYITLPSSDIKQYFEGLGDVVLTNRSGRVWVLVREKIAALQSATDAMAEKLFVEANYSLQKANRDSHVVAKPVDIPDPKVIFLSRFRALAAQASIRIATAIDRPTIEQSVRTILQAERWADLLGLVNADDRSSIGSALRALHIRFEDVAQQRLGSATTSVAMRDGLIDLLALERLIKLLLAGPSDEKPSGPEASSAYNRFDTRIQTELTRAFQASGVSLSSELDSAIQRLKTSARIEDADTALSIFYVLFSTSPPAGMTEEARLAQRKVLATAIVEAAPRLQADTLSRIRNASGIELTDLVARFDFLANLTKPDDNFTGVVSSWQSQTEGIACSAAPRYVKRLLDPAMRFVNATKDVREKVEALWLRCMNVTGGTVTEQNLAQYELDRRDQYKSLSDALDTMTDRSESGEPAALLKEELAWKIAGMVKDLTAPFQNGDTETQKALWRVHGQTDFILRHRKTSLNDRVEAGIHLLSEPLLEMQNLDPVVRDQIRRISDGLIIFAQHGGAAKSGVDQGLDLVYGLTYSFIEPRLAKRLLGLAYAGLLEARKPVNKTKNSSVPIFLTLMAGYYIGEDLLVGDSSNNAQSSPLLSDDQVDLVMGLLKVASLYESATKQDKTPLERTEAVFSMLDEAEKLRPVSRYVKPLIRPEQFLLAPDSDQAEYIMNLLLAELGAARNDNPVNVNKAYKSTCPGFTAEGGVHYSGPQDANSVYVCAIDLAREAINSHMQAAINPNSVVGQNQRAQQAVATMRREAVFAPAIGGENLSGVAGGLEYRNGQFESFDMITSFGMQGFFESAATITYSVGPPGLLTLRQASADNRDAGLLGSLGLSAPGTNQLFGTSVFNNPIKQLFVQVGGPNACLNLRASLGATTPIGLWQTGEQGLTACADPFGLDLDVQANTGFAIFQSISTFHLFYANGNGGLDLGQRVGIDSGGIIPEPVLCDDHGRCNYWKWWGAYANVALGAGISAGSGGLELRGNASANLGIYNTEQDEVNGAGKSACVGMFEPSGFTYANVRYGTCRKNLGVGMDFKVGTTFNDFYFKGRAGVDVIVGYLGVWVYRMGDVSDAGAGNFPSDRYGGFVMLDPYTFVALRDEGVMP